MPRGPSRAPAAGKGEKEMAMVWILLAAAGLVLLISFVTYRMCFYSPQKGQNDIYNYPSEEQYLPYREGAIRMIRAMAEEPCKMVSIRSRDGLTLTGRYYARREGAPLAICFHGYRATGLRDFCGGSRAILDRGYDLLLVDQRAQGNSAGHTMTFGIREREDCHAWVRWAAETLGKERAIVLYGISMGAATVLMASGEPFAGNVRCIVADSPYSSPKEIIKKVCREDLRLPASLCWWFLRLGARLWGRFDPEETTAAAEVKKAKVPILLIHGEDDRFVPCEMSKEIAAASPLVERHTFPGAGHGLSYMTDRERYLTLVDDILSRTAEGQTNDS